MGEENFLINITVFTRKINIGDRWVTAIKSSTTDKELFAVYKSELPLLTELFDYFVSKHSLKQVELADFGGGIGDVTDFIKKNSKAEARIVVTSFDISDTLLAENNSADIKTSIDLIELSEKEKFDVGIMRFVLNYNTKNEQLKILSNINASLKKENVFINWWCGVSSKEHQDKFQKLFGTTEINEKLFRPNSYWTTWEENEQLFKEVGFVLEIAKKFILPIEHLYKVRYELTDEENTDVLKFLDKYNFISYVIFKAVKQ